MAEEQGTTDGRSPIVTARIVIAALLFAIVIAVVVDNRRETRIGYVVGDVTAPLFVVVLLAAVLGAAIGWLILHNPRRRDSGK